MNFRRNNIAALLAAVPLATLTAQAAGTLAPANLDLAYDRTLFGSGLLAVQIGASSGTPDSFSVTVKLKHSDTLTGSDYTDLLDKDGNAVQIAATTEGSFATLAVDLEGAKKYVSANVVVAFTGGTSPKISGTVALVLGGAAEGMPPTAPTANNVA
jgi:hypothetical protein